MENNAKKDSFALLRPVETQRASEVIYEQIKALIISGELKPGDRLPSERRMMDAFQRSRPTVREALRMLERSDLVRIVPGTRGAVVQEISSVGVERPLRTLIKANKITLKDLVEYRLYNEAAVARWAAQRRTQDDLEVIQKVLDRARSQMERKDFSAFIRCDMDFHSAVAQAGKNQVSCILTRVLGGFIDNFMDSVFQRQTQAENDQMCGWILEQHQAIFDAVREGVPDSAEHAMTLHIQSSHNDLRKYEDVL